MRFPALAKKKEPCGFYRTPLLAEQVQREEECSKNKYKNSLASISRPPLVRSTRGGPGERRIPLWNTNGIARCRSAPVVEPAGIRELKTRVWVYFFEFPLAYACLQHASLS